MTDLTDTELAHERSMSRLGEEHYFSVLARAIEKDRRVLTPPGRALVRPTGHCATPRTMTATGIPSAT